MKTKRIYATEIALEGDKSTVCLWMIFMLLDDNRGVVAIEKHEAAPMHQSEVDEVLRDYMEYADIKDRHYVVNAGLFSDDDKVINDIAHRLTKWLPVSKRPTELHLYAFEAQ